MLFTAKLLLPLINDTLPQLVQFLTTRTAAAFDSADNDASRAQLCCYLLAKALHRCTRVYMPLQLGTVIAAAPPQGFLPNLLQLLEVRKCGNPAAGDTCFFDYLFPFNLLILELP